MRLLVALAAVMLTLASSSSSAYAQSSAVREGAALLVDAEFERAIEVLEGALAHETLTRADTAMSLDRLAIAHHALGHADDVRRVLWWLAVVERDHEFGPDVPPELAALAADARQERPPEVRIDVVADELSQISLEVAFEGAQEVLAVELRCASPGEPARVVRDRRPEMTVPRTATCDATAIGPGSLHVATARRLGTAPAAGAPDEALWIGLGVGTGALVLAAGITALGIALSERGGAVQLSTPTVLDW